MDWAKFGADTGSTIMRAIQVCVSLGISVYFGEGTQETLMFFIALMLVNIYLYIPRR